MKTFTSLGMLSAFLGAASAIVPGDFIFVANQEQPSLFTAEFKDSTNIFDGTGKLAFDVQIPGGFGAYKGFQCRVLLDYDNMGGSFRDLQMEEYESKTAGYSAYDGTYTITGTADRLRNFELWCTFVAPSTIPITKIASVSLDYKTDHVENKNTNVQIKPNIPPVNAPVLSVARAATFANPTIIGFKNSASYSKSLVVATPNAQDATYGTEMVFSGPYESFCDVWWDNVLYTGSATVRITESHILSLTFGSALNAGNDVHVECSKVSGYKLTRGAPSIAQFTVTDAGVKRHAYTFVASSATATSVIIAASAVLLAIASFF